MLVSNARIADASDNEGRVAELRAAAVPLADAVGDHHGRAIATLEQARYDPVVLDRARLIGESLAVVAELANARLVAESLGALAWLHIERDSGCAVRLSATARALWDQRRLRQWPADRARVDERIELLRTRLADGEFGRAWREGKTAPLEELRRVRNLVGSGPKDGRGRPRRGTEGGWSAAHAGPV